MEVFLNNITPGLPNSLILDESVAVPGGEGIVRFSSDNKYAVKIFKDHVVDAKRKKMRHILRDFQNISQEQERFILPPLALVHQLDAKEAFGFVMRRVPDNYKELIKVILGPMTATAHFRSGVHWGHLLHTARSIAEAIAVLHGRGFSHTDIHYRNFMVNVREAQAVMLEIDGVTVEGMTTPDVAGFPGFIAPEILTSWRQDVSHPHGGSYTTLPNKYTDSYSLAILILHTLLLRNVMTPLVDYADNTQESDRLGYGKHALFSEHKTYKRHRPSGIGEPLYNRGQLSYLMLTPKLQRLAESAFIDHLFTANARPLASEWAAALAEAADGLTLCGRCGQYFLYQHWLLEKHRRTCPFCGAQPSSHPHVMEFREEGVKGVFRSVDRFATFGNGDRLYAYQIQPNRVPPLRKSDRDVIGRAEWDPSAKRLILVNESDSRWQYREHTVLRRQAVPFTAEQ